MLEARTLLSSTFVVRNTNDAGADSLRQAILNANASGDSSNLITFNIAGSGPQVISLLSALPAISATVTIDGTTQPGYSGVPLIELDGSMLDGGDFQMPGLELDGSHDVVQGLQIYHFYDGIDVNGPRANIVGFHGDNAQILGNYIGLIPDPGSFIFGNQNNGITIDGGSVGSVLADGAVISGNVIYGNNGDGIAMIHAHAATITGNIIGLDPTGTLRASNTVDGINLVDCSNVTIGGSSAADRNVISGNFSDGVRIIDSSSNVIRGNYIGTDVSGMLVADATGQLFGNDGDGIRIVGSNTNSTDNLIAGNVISNNGGDGVALDAYDTDPNQPNVLIDNLIGTDALGTTPLGNGGAGVHLIEGGLVIGQAGHGNIISGNQENGIRLDDAALVQGNMIGLGADGSAMGNGRFDGLGNPFFNGIFIDADGSTINGNTIAYNTVDGIDVASGSQNDIRGNSIYSNGALGIDLGGDGPVSDATHANNGQVFPVLTSVIRHGGMMTITGMLTAAPGVYEVDLFSSAAGDPSGYGEGQTYLGSITVTVDTSGSVSFTAGFAGVAGSQTVATATATDSSGNTSEFSADAVIPPAVTPTTTTLLSSVDPSVFGQSVTFTATVTGTGGSTPSGSVLFMEGATLLGTATLDGTGVATLTLSNLSVSGHTITAVYGGDAGNLGSSDSLSQLVNKDHTSTTLTSSSTSSTYGQSLTFTATVSLADLGAGMPSGLVTFLDGATVVGTASVAADGTAVLTTSSLSVGGHTITAVYSGDDDFAGSASAPLSQAISAIQTQTTLGSSVDPSVFGQSFMLTATVSALSGSGVPSGSILFMDGLTVLGSVPLDGNGMATLTLSNLAVGDHAITATYSGDAFDAGSSAALTETVQKSHTSTTLSASTASTMYGQAITFTATVAIADQGAGMLGGMVAFMDGATLLGSAALDANGQATLTVSNLAVGGHSITASYGGDDHFTSSASDAVSEQVSLIPTATSLVSSMASSAYGQAVTFTAGVIAVSGGVPSGSVLFMDGADILGSAALEASGVASLTVSNLSVGSHSITASYGGSATDAASASAPLSQSVGKISTSTTLTSSADPSVYGQAVTLTATVNGGGSGSVMFMEGSAVLGTVALDAGGKASIKLSGLSVGGHDITASYGGDDTHSGSSASLTQNVNRDKTNTYLQLSATSIDFGQSVVFTAQVSIADLGSGTPTGSVTFMDGDSPVGTVVLGADGVATFTCSSQAVGGHVITAVYSGDGNFAGSISNAVDEAVNMLGTSTSLMSSVDPSSYGQSALFTATVSGGLDPTGMVTFRDGSTVLGMVAIDSNGVAKLTISSLSVASHTITATYGGDADNAGSSASLMQVVNKDATATTLTSSSSSVTYGQSVTFTATVSLTGPGAGMPTGSITFKDGSTVLSTVAIDSNGVAKLTVSSLSVGGHVITASYGGDANDAPSDATLAQSVTQRATTTMLASSLNPSVYGQSVTFTASVSNGTAPLSGSVSFMDGSTVLGTVALNGSGVATLTVSKLAVGGHTITANYSGDANDAASSGSLSQSVSQDKTATTLSSSANPSVYGQSITLTATLTNLTLGGPQAGSIVFMDGSSVLGTVAVNGNGVATLTISSLSVASHAITASFAGDANDAASSAALTQVVNKVSTTTTLASTANPSVYGQSITLTATVAGSSPSGSVVFMDGSTVLGTISLSGGKASLTMSSFAVGAHAITATYSGDTNNGASSAALNQTVNKDKTTTSVTSSSSTVSSVQPVTFTATVKLADVGSGTPTGTVTFTDGSTVLGTSTLSANGVATLTVSSLSFGAHQIVATYSGDANFLPSANSTPLGVTSTAGILLLDPTAKGSLTDSGNAKIIANGATIFVDSANASAVVLNGNATVQAAVLDITGGDTTSGNSHLNAVVQTGQQPMADPLAGLAAPTTAGMSVYSATSISADAVVTLNPGVYVGGISLSGNAKVTLNPGVYYMQGGGFTVSGNASVTDLGKGVLIYNAPVRSSDGISFTGNGSVQLSAMTCGAWAGITLFQARGASAVMTVSGNGTLNVAGAIYATGATLQVTGNAGVAVNGSILDTFGTTLILDDLVVSGNGCLVV
jgi:parallel beta-helix repeat protein